MIKLCSSLLGTLPLSVLGLTLVHAQPAHQFPLLPLDLKEVRISDGFWLKRIETNRLATIPHVIRKCYETGRVDNLLFAAGLKQGEYCTVYQFDDSDVFKSIEAASYALRSTPDDLLDAQLDSLIAIIALVQEEDGYLYSPRRAPSERIKRAIGPERWSLLQWSHELYTLGHLYEAAAAHSHATGKRTLLDVALKSAELVLHTFNPRGLQIPPGHQEIELGLVALYNVTGDLRYLRQARYFLDIRGRGEELSGRDSWGQYAQDHAPVLDQREAVGHAVRAAYMYSSMTDIAALMDDQQYRSAVDALWQNVCSKKLYLTGGIGSTGYGEAIGGEYDLPNASAYNETCSSIATMMWNFRMFQLFADGKFLDLFERTLYNAFLSGVSMDGTSFFYPNPLQSFGTHERTPWFTCACCPPNVARFIASLPAKLYAVNGANLFVNLFASSEARVTVGNTAVTVRQETDYPWHGAVRIVLQPDVPETFLTLLVRIPGWSLNKPVEGDLYRFVGEAKQPSITLNGQSIALTVDRGFVAISRRWKPGDVVELVLPMDIRRVLANERVEADRGRVALQRGPLVYCVEWPDTEDGHVRHLLLPDDASLSATYRQDLLNGVVTVGGHAEAYAVVGDGGIRKHRKAFTAIPYYAWAHRGAGEMSVWLARTQEAVSPLHGPTLASQSSVTVSSGKNQKAINDQIEPASSDDESVPFFHWWPKKGTMEWVQFDFPASAEVSKVEIYWFDDTGRGECRVPKSWRVLYYVDGKWNPVYAPGGYGVEKNTFNAAVFETVKTRSIRIEIESQSEYAAGIHEIKLR